MKKEIEPFAVFGWYGDTPKRPLSAKAKAEHAHLINLWNCSEPMTPEQLERLEQLDELAKYENKN
jgi:hypothetical protein